MTAPGALADPRVRLGAGTVALLVTAVAVHHDRVRPGETAAFRAINGLPGSLYRPAWAVMQLGTLGAVPVTAAVAAALPVADVLDRLASAPEGLTEDEARRTYRESAPAGPPPVPRRRRRVQRRAARFTTHHRLRR